MMEGEMGLTLDCGEKRIVKKGEALVQGACMRSWKNVSKAEPARMDGIAIGDAGAKEEEIKFPKH
jgi:quercetin dioxygenase-like cupin family protein